MTQLTATFTVTIKTKPDGDYYFDHDDLVRNVVPWIEGGLDDRDDIAEVTITEQPAVVSAAVEPPADQTTPSLRAGLREQLAGALIAWTYRGKEPDPETGILETVRANAYSRADAVLAVLCREWPWLRAEAEDAEPADQAAVLRWAADHIEDHELLPTQDLKFVRGVDWALGRLRRMADETATTQTQPARCVCGHPIGLHHEDVCLRTDCGCADALEINAVPEALEAVLTERYTELGNSFSRMRRQEQGPDGWPAERPVGPHHVAETLRELLRRAATDGPGLRLPDHTVNEEETPPPAPRDRHRAAWNALTPQQQAAYLAQLDSAGARQDQTTTDEPERCAHCTHPKRDHDGRADHQAKHSPLVAGDPWCHACDGPCDYAAGARQDGGRP